MPVSSLEHKTVRPGSLGSYSYYHSRRLPARSPQPTYRLGNRPKAGAFPRGKLVAIGLLAAGVIGLFMLLSGRPEDKTVANQQNPSTSKAAPTAPAAAAATPAPAQPVNRCAGNTLDKLVKVSINQRHMWACEGSKLVHEAPVITGMLAYASTLTPHGDYKIYAKTTNTTLSGSDEAGSWSRPVHFWMPFLDNEHGTYGFHDATWRPDSEFGNIDPKTDQASHGCVELPLASMEWLYNWAPAHTALTVES